MVVTLDRSGQRFAIHANFFAKTRDRPAPEEIAGFNEATQVTHSRMNQTDSEVRDEAAIADQVGWNIARAKHALNEVVIRIGLVDKTFSTCTDSQYSRLGAIQHDVREYREIAVGLRHHRTRHPRYRTAVPIVDVSVGAFTGEDAVAGVGVGRK